MPRSERGRRRCNSRQPRLPTLWWSARSTDRSRSATRCRPPWAPPPAGCSSPWAICSDAKCGTACAAGPAGATPNPFPLLDEHVARVGRQGDRRHRLTLQVLVGAAEAECVGRGLARIDDGDAVGEVPHVHLALERVSAGGLTRI